MADRHSTSNGGNQAWRAGVGEHATCWQPAKRLVAMHSKQSPAMAKGACPHPDTGTGTDTRLFPERNLERDVSNERKCPAVHHAAGDSYWSGDTNEFDRANERAWGGHGVQRSVLDCRSTKKGRRFGHWWRGRHLASPRTRCVVVVASTALAVRWATEPTARVAKARNHWTQLTVNHRSYSGDRHGFPAPCCGATDKQRAPGLDPPLNQRVVASRVGRQDRVVVGFGEITKAEGRGAVETTVPQESTDFIVNT